MIITRDDILEVLKKIATKIEENREYITDLDSATGDGDHWANMNMGFKKIVDEIDNLKVLEIPELIKKVGMLLMSTIGGSSGVLYGTAFIRASQVIAGKSELDKNDISRMMEAGLEGIMTRGKAKPGDKTMIDTLFPASNAFKAAIESDLNLHEAANVSKEAGYNGMLSTKDMSATKGRAFYQANKGLGHIDPGAVTLYYMIEVFSDYIVNK